jgi:phage terminase large subunit GpA-like protein
VFAVKGAKEEGGVKKDYGIVSNMASTNQETGHTWYMVSTLTAKEELAYKLDIGPQLEGIFFPHSAIRAGNGRFFAGLVAERSVTNSRTGRIEWKRRGQLTGEPLDCFVYAMAARELARRKYAAFRDLDRAADFINAPDQPSLVTVDRKLQDHSAQADTMAGVIAPLEIGQRVALPMKRKKPPMDFTIKKRPGGSRGRSGWGRF